MIMSEANAVEMAARRTRSRSHLLTVRHFKVIPEFITEQVSFKTVRVVLKNASFLSRMLCKGPAKTSRENRASVSK
jgi:hypothetical protein